MSAACTKTSVVVDKFRVSRSPRNADTQLNRAGREPDPNQNRTPDKSLEAFVKPLKLNGKPFDAKALTPALQRFVDKFSELPTDEVFTSQGLAARWKMNFFTFGTNMRFAAGALKSYRYKNGKDFIWGHPKAIAEYRRQVEAL